MTPERKHLKPGDAVVVRHGHGRGAYRLDRVERLTATQVILVSGRKFRIDNGRAVGAGGWDIPLLLIAPHDFHEARRQTAEAALAKSRPLTRAGIEATRYAAKLAEEFLDADDALKNVAKDPTP